MNDQTPITHVSPSDSVAVSLPSLMAFVLQLLWRFALMPPTLHNHPNQLPFEHFQRPANRTAQIRAIIKLRLSMIAVD